MLGSIALAIVYGLKVNLSVAIVGMVKHTEAPIVNVSKTANSTPDIVCYFNDSGSGNATISAQEVSVYLCVYDDDICMYICGK